MRAPRFSLALILLALPQGASVRAQDARPNVLFLMSDQHRWHAMGHTELPELRTPNLDRLAEEGVSLRRALSNYPLCAPTRAMLWTGRWPHQTGVLDNAYALDADENTLGKTFRAAGYVTGYIGKWHLGEEHGRAFGFDHSILWENTADHWSSIHQREGGRPLGYSDYNAVGMADQALEFLAQEHASPFLLVVSFDPPHPALEDPPREFRRLYPKGTLPLRGNVSGAWLTGEFRRFQGYHAHVSALDRELGRVLEGVQRLERETIVVYTSDHGTMLGSQGFATAKRLPYDESVRVPFLVRWPGHVPAGVQPDALFSLIDVFPTLCGLAGVAVPESCAGRDRSGLFLGRAEDEPTEAVLLMHVELALKGGGAQERVPLYRGLRTETHTFAVQADGPWLLFDDVADPLQQTNLVADPAHAELRRGLAEQLEALLRKAEDPFVIPEDAKR